LAVDCDKVGWFIIPFLAQERESSEGLGLLDVLFGSRAASSIKIFRWWSWRIVRVVMIREWPMGGAPDCEGVFGAVVVAVLPCVIGNDCLVVIGLAFEEGVALGVVP
jgi:hypothetical protein